VKPLERPTTVGSSIRLRNWPSALIADWMMPVPSSPEAVVSPAGVSATEAAGMLPVELKKLVSVVATFCWLTLRPLPAGVKLTPILRNALLLS
jgi:hypothetical protein